MIDREDEADIEAFAEAVASSLPPRQRDVLALYGAGCKRPEIAAHLDIRDRVVKRDLLEILEQARTVLAHKAAGGCEFGESLVVRLACGLAKDVEASQAQLHIDCCEQCEQFYARLNLWREKVGAILPVPVAAQAQPNIIERTLHKTLDGLGSLRQQLADGGAQIKQQATTTYVRAADPTPLAGARPGAVAAVVAGCLAVGTGTYTCVEQGINPLTSLPGLGEQAPEQRATNPPPEKTTEETPPPTPTPVAVEPAPVPEPQPTPQPEPTPAPTTTEAQPPPYQPEQEFTPATQVTPSTSSQPSSASSSTPAPVADGNGGGEFEP